MSVSDESGHRPRQPREAQVERSEPDAAVALRELHQEDAEREDLYPRAEPDRRARPEQAEVAVSQGLKPVTLPLTRAVGLTGN